MSTSQNQSDERSDEELDRQLVVSADRPCGHGVGSKFLRALATGMILAASTASSMGAVTPVPETFAADMPAGRHDTVTQVTMDDGAKLWVKVLGDDPGKPLLMVHHSRSQQPPGARGVVRVPGRPLPGARL